MPVGSLGRAAIGAWVLIALIACSDDDPNMAPDASTDASTDGSAGSGGNFIPRRDAQVQATDPIQVCDRAVPSSCPDGLVCDMLIRLFPGESQFTIYTGCLEPARERGLGDPCDPDITNGTPYTTEGLTDLVFRDPCGEGLTCGPDPMIRDGASCRPICQSGRANENRLACREPNTYCVGSPLRESCIPAEGCDVTGQTGCRPGTNCYLRTNDTLDGFLAVCLPPQPELVPDGTACEYINHCQPGSSCLGPLSLPPTRWGQEMAFACRRGCTADGADEDAGVDDDAGVGGACPSGTSCSPFADTGLSLPGLSNPPYGQCE